MMRLKRLICTMVCMILLLLTTISSADELMRVRVNCLTNSESFIVDMGDTKPIIVNDRTLVPLRAVCEAAGFKVGWDQDTKTVYVKLIANESSAAPIERYCAKLMKKTQVASLGVKPEYIYIEMPVNNRNYAIKYTYSDGEGDVINFGKTEATDIPATFGVYGTVMIPLRCVMESFSLGVGWDGEENLSSVTIPENVIIPTGMQTLSQSYAIPAAYTTTISDQVAAIVAGETATTPTTQTTPVATPTQQQTQTTDLPSNVELGSLIGNFRISHYCPCSVCNGGWGATTSWAGALIPGQTIAVDPTVIGKLQWVYIEGYGLRRAEDCGGAIKGFKIDMCVTDHATAMRMGVVYKNVYAVTFK